MFYQPDVGKSLNGMEGIAESEVVLIDIHVCRSTWPRSNEGVADVDDGDREVLEDLGSLRLEIRLKETVRLG